MSEPSKPLIPASKSRWFALGALGVAGAAFLAIASGGIGKNLVYYWGPTELVQAGHKAEGATIRLGGQVVPGSVHFDSASSTLNFEVRDKKEQVRVHSQGVPPQMFRENVGVVVEGTMTPEGVFDSSRLMVSHDNQYKAPKAGQDVKTADLMTTTAGMAEEKRP
jgi:cytochrome c-type biogenesis protein CcmE